MKAATLIPKQKDSAKLMDLPVPSPGEKDVLVRILEVGIDGTDIEISRGSYGEPPPGQDYLVAGHEALGEVEASSSSEFAQGDLVAPMVRRPDDCINCRNGLVDMCIDGNYRECGIKGANGYLSEFIIEKPEFLIKVDPFLAQPAVLIEPLSVAIKGIDQAIEIHSRVVNPIRKALVLGAGPLGLLSSAVLQLQDFDTYTLDKVPRSNLKAKLVEALGVTYLDGNVSPVVNLPAQLGNLDLIIEATGDSTVAFQAICATLGTNGVFCLMGVSTGEKPLVINSDLLNMQMVLGNKVVFGSVNSNRRHFERSLQLVSQIETRWPGWMNRLITRRLPLEEFKNALQHPPDNIKTIIEINPLKKR